MGPVPGLRDFHVLAGFSIFGIVFAGGAGSYAAEWIVDGQPSDNMWELDVRRFGDYAADTAVRRRPGLRGLRARVRDPLPEEERPAGRPLKPTRSTTGCARGARSSASASAGSGRCGSRDGRRPQDEYSFRRGNWLEAVGEECRAVRSAVGVLDQTSFAKYESSGPGQSSCSTGSARTACRRTAGSR